MPVSCIKDKFICLLFSAKWCKPCNCFMGKLLDLYKTLNSTSPACNLEILFVSLDHNESSFLDHFKEMPWLAVPFDQKIIRKLRFTFHVEQIPSLIPLVLVDGNVLVEEDAVRLVESYGVDAFPFGMKRRKELEATDETKRQGGKLEELIGCKDRNYLISNDDSKVNYLFTELLSKLNYYSFLFLTSLINLHSRSVVNMQTKNFLFIVSICSFFHFFFFFEKCFDFIYSTASDTRSCRKNNWALLWGTLVSPLQGLHQIAYRDLQRVGELRNWELQNSFHLHGPR